MNKWHLQALSGAMIASFIFGGCSSRVQEHYVSPHVQGESAKINLDEVQKAFFDSKGKDFNTWMGAFEKRVNEIYDGKGVVSIDATRNDGKLVVTGFIDKDNKDGFQPGDEKLFAIEQTGDAVNNEMPYRVANADGATYYQGHHSLLDNPFLQMMLVSHMMGGFGGRYYTPRPQVVILQQGRDVFRSSPTYQTQQASNRSFYSRFKTNSTGDLTSRSRFGGLGSSGSTMNRTFGGTTSGATTGSSWGGRRSGFGSGSFGGFGGRSRGWGGRRGR